MTVSLRELTAEELRAALPLDGDIPLQQLPSYAAVKDEWGHVFLGWIEDGRTVGTALVLLRRLPRTRWMLAYVPEGPVLDWTRPDALAMLGALADNLRSRGCFMLKIGPRIPMRRWTASTIRAAMKAGSARRWRDITPDDLFTPAVELARELDTNGWRRYTAPGAGFGGTLQPRYGFELDLASRTDDELRAGMSTQWRRNITRADRKGVVVTTPGYPGLPAFHELLEASGDRGGFAPRDLAFFQRMWRAMTSDDPTGLTLYLGSTDGTPHAGMLMAMSGTRASYTFGGSDEAGRDARPSNAVQWRMARDARDRGATVLDLRGASDGIGPDAPDTGLTAFKAGLGADAFEYLGEWDLELRPWLARPFRRYWNRRPH